MTTRPDAYHHGDLRRALVETAATLLERDGAETLSLRGVAAATGVSHAAPYRHFESKRALLTALAALGFADFAAGITAATGPGPDAVLASCGRAYLDFARRRPAMYRLMFGSDVVVGSPSPELGQTSIAAFHRLRDAVAACLPESPARDRLSGAVTAAVWAQLHGLALLLTEDRVRPWMVGTVPPESLVDATLATLADQARATAARLE